MRFAQFCLSLPLLLVLCTGVSVVQANDTPQPVANFTREFCIKCHGLDVKKGDFRIDTLQWDFSETNTREQWELVSDYISDGDMPPKKARSHPDNATRQTFLKSLSMEFAKADRQAKVGGTPLRRLNRVEYLNTVRDLFGIRMINLPLSFPQDIPDAEFDTMPEGLMLSSAVMEAYHETATDVANRIVPLPGGSTYQAQYTTETIGGDQSRRWIGPYKPEFNRVASNKRENVEYLMFTGFNDCGMLGALWDPWLVGSRSGGVYRMRLLANAQAKAGADGKPLRLGFYALDPKGVRAVKRFRRERATLVAEIDVPVGKPVWIEVDVPVEEGETIHIYCENRFAEGRYPTNGLSKGDMRKWVPKLRADPAPTIELRGLSVKGPVSVLPRVRSFFGSYPPKLNREELASTLLPLAARAYRRPLTNSEKEQLISSVLAQGEKTGSSEVAWHYGIRRILCSPSFLYRETASEPTALAAGPKHEPEASADVALDEFALASRLSYFLWSSMPDDELLNLAAEGKLMNPDMLISQTQRMLADPKSQEFVKHFTGQWLGNRKVAAINVCDNRYLWVPAVRYGYIRSTELFFNEVLRDNLPIATFIDSDFTYANNAMQIAALGMKPMNRKRLNQIDALQRNSLIWPEPKRIDLVESDSAKKKGSSLPDHVRNRGGVLGLPGVLTVSGDGVESSPILRGVWVMENLFGQHPPPPPKDVPALDIDTSQATSVRETLKAHTQLETCAKCHRDIDPLGLALENYDAIGGWRSNYIGQKQPINAQTTMPDGTALDGAASIKSYLKQRPEIFTHCLLTKLLEYGAGRKLSVGDRRVVKEIVKAEPPKGYFFSDLIRLAIQSDVFLTK